MPIRLYVSSSPDMEPEREAVGRAVASLPISTGWEIHHTPHPEEPLDQALALAASCDLFVVLLGADFAAPMGGEWRQAMESRRVVLAFHREGLHSPSGEWALRQRDVAWEPFSSAQELEGLLARRLARALLDRGERLGLRVEDVERLLAFLSEEEPPSPGPDRRTGAGRSGVILGREG